MIAAGALIVIDTLTDRLEAAAYDYFAKIDELGGMVEAVKRNYPQREIADAAFVLQTEIDAHERIVVGVNAHLEGDDGELQILRIDPALERKQIDRVQGVRARTRSGSASGCPPLRPPRGARRAPPRPPARRDARGRPGRGRSACARARGRS